MSDIAIASIEELETLAAWHRINADHADCNWIWELRVRAAEELERRAADLRATLPPATGRRGRSASGDRWSRGGAISEPRPSDRRPPLGEL